jgi:hypothetical protein
MNKENDLFSGAHREPGPAIVSANRWHSISCAFSLEKTAKSQVPWNPEENGIGKRNGR